MIDSATPSDEQRPQNTDLAQRFARAVRETAERPAELAALRTTVKEITTAAATAGAVRFAPSAAGLLVNDTPLAAGNEDTAHLASRLDALGIEELTLTPRVAPADLTELIRLLATIPAGAGAPAQFAARAAVIDSRTVPRRLKARAEPAADSVTVPAPPTASAGSPKRPTKERERRATPPVAADAVPAAAADAAREEESDITREALPVPETKDARLAAMFVGLDAATETPALRTAIDALGNFAELAFRTGNDDGLIEALAGLVGLEFVQLERDAKDERRQAFTHAFRRLARPVLLRQLAVLRHRRATDALAVARLQAILQRFGTDGADAVIDEFGAASTQEASAACLVALRGLRRTFDALLPLVRDPTDPTVTQAAAVLGALGGTKSEELLSELLHHPSERARRAAVAAFARLGTPLALDALRIALGDESPKVRSRAVAALEAKGTPEGVAMLAPLLASEPEREVLFGAVAALGVIGGPEAQQLLVRVAEGTGEHAQRRTAALRIQACTALVAIRTPAAMACVQGLAGDRDRELRDAAVRLVAQAQRRTTSSQAVVATP